MENFETDFDNSGYFDELILAISETSGETIEIGEELSIEEIDLNCETLLASDLMTEVCEVFEKHVMNEHIATIDLLGNLGYSDMLMYYSIVTDCAFVNSVLENDDETQLKIATPEQFIKEKETIKCSFLELEFYVSKIKMAKLLRVLQYLKNKEFKILSNTFYMDGSDFIVFLNLKSVVGYNLRIRFVFKSDSMDEAVALNNSFCELQQKIMVGEEL